MTQLKSIVKSKAKGKKLTATFVKNGKEKKVHFGAAGYTDYTKNKDPQKKKAYIARHRKNENWKDPTKPGTLSRYILWEDTSLKSAIKKYKNRFKL